MIPKVIHFCWLSKDPYPQKIQMCIDSWKKVLPDYEIVLWDTERFPLAGSKWVEDAFNARKYAFAADYIRCYALYNYGGIYLDSDVEVIKPFDDLLGLPYFFCSENSNGAIEAATMGCEPKMQIFKQMLDYYDSRSFIQPGGKYDLTTIPVILGEQLSACRKKYISAISEFEYGDSVFCILPKEYFSPKTNDGKLKYLTKNTYSIHHYAESWVSPAHKFFRSVVVAVGGVPLKNKVGKFLRRIHVIK